MVAVVEHRQSVKVGRRCAIDAPEKSHGQAGRLFVDDASGDRYGVARLGNGRKMNHFLDHRRNVRSCNGVGSAGRAVHNGAGSPILPKIVG